jgi:hypothetical protein
MTSHPNIQWYSSTLQNRAKSKIYNEPVHSNPHIFFFCCLPKESFQIRGCSWRFVAMYCSSFLDLAVLTPRVWVITALIRVRHYPLTLQRTRSCNQFPAISYSTTDAQTRDQVLNRIKQFLRGFAKRLILLLYILMYSYSVNSRF